MLLLSLKFITPLRLAFLSLLLLVLPLVGMAQTNTGKTVKAQPGDGIYSLLLRHGLSTQDLPQFISLNKTKLGKDNSLYAGREYILPAKGNTATVKAKENPGYIIEPLFGKKYEKVKLQDERLKGAVYYLVSGHGGPDPGAVGKYGPYQLAEDEYAYDVTLRLARTLMESGAKVYMIVKDDNDGIRDTPVLKMDSDEVNHSGRKIPLSQKYRLRQRTSEINALYAKHKGMYQRMIVIHVDSRSKGQNIDVFFYHHENSAAGEKLAQNIHQTFTTKYRRYQPNRDYFGNVSHRSSLYVIKYSHPPTVFIELGNIKSKIDQRRFVIPNNRQALANWISEGLMSDYKTK